MTKEEAYQKATAQELSNGNGTRMDVIYAAMGIYKHAALEKVGRDFIKALREIRGELMTNHINGLRQMDEWIRELDKELNQK